MAKQRALLAASVAALAALGLGACGGDDGAAEDAASQAAAAGSQIQAAASSAADAAQGAASQLQDAASSLAAEAGSAAESVADDAVAAAGDPAAGKEVFSSSCASCHTLSDADASGAVGPNLDELKPDAATVAAKVAAGGGGMPAFAGQLSPADIANVSAYVSSATGG